MYTSILDPFSRIHGSKSLLHCLLVRIRVCLVFPLFDAMNMHSNAHT